VNFIFTPQSWDDYQFWVATDKKVLKRINELLKDVIRSPFDGIGKAEPLRHALAGYWSRRITDEHRMVYRQTEAGIVIVQLRYHYQRS
jgi:toxin YoeB